jgi:hypothetical protein
MSLTENVFKNFVQNENKHFEFIDVNYMDKQSHFNSQMKTTLITWLIEVSNIVKQSDNLEFIFIAVNIVDIPFLLLVFKIFSY